jgi:hypothetical protein
MDAWYTGDVDALSWLYATNQLQQNTSIWGQVRRKFWGTPTPQTSSQRPIKMHVPAAADIARMASHVVLAQMPDVRFGDGDHDDDDKNLTDAQGKASTDRLVELLDDEAHAALLEAGELRAAHGGVYVKIAWDEEIVPDGPFLDTVAADAAVPVFRSGRLAAVTFWTDLAPLDGDNGSFKLLELHEPGRIEFGLFRASSQKELGRRVPLTDHPGAEHLADLVDADASIATGSTLLTAVYIPWSRPNGKLRKDPTARDFGKSAFDGAEDILDQIDEVYSAWMRDIRLGKARIIVPKGLIDIGPAGQGGVFDADKEVFTETGEQVGSLNQGAAKGSVESFIEMFQPNIRYLEHMHTAMHLLARLYQACGFSPQSFGDAGEVAVTATEVTARESLTDLTRSASIMYWRPQLKRIFAALLDVDKFVFNGPGRGDALPDVDFADSDTITPEVLARTLQLINIAEAASTETKVRMLNPDWDDEKVTTEVAQIKADLSMLPDPTLAHLWAAQADNGSATGGVKAGQSGVSADPAQLATDKTTIAGIQSREGKLSGNADQQPQ